LLIVAGSILMNGLVRYMIYPAPWVRVPSVPPTPCKEIVLSVSENTKITGWYSGMNRDAPFLLYFHGNGENLATLWETGIFQRFEELGVNILAVDYPGYGRSSGKPSETSVLKSAQVALNWVSENFPDKKLIVCGWSLGAAVAILTAARNQETVRGVVALSAWTSIVEVARKHYPGWLVNLLLKEKYDSSTAAKEIHTPALIIHGQMDRIIPVQQGRILADNFLTSPHFIEIKGADHNSLLAFPEVWQAISSFVASISK
jgi:pimeloyl-ACP methyl ester carboxylesterase